MDSLFALIVLLIGIYVYPILKEMWAGQKRDLDQRRKELAEMEERRQELINKCGAQHHWLIENWLHEIRQNLHKH